MYLQHSWVEGVILAENIDNDKGVLFYIGDGLTLFQKKLGVLEALIEESPFTN